MRILTLVPALAIIAAPLTAAETVKIDGFVDTIWSGSAGKETRSNALWDKNGNFQDGPDDQDDASGDTKDGFASSFSASAKLGIGLTISEKVKAQIDIVATGDQNAAGDTDVILVRQAYGTWQVTPEVEFKSGKFISEIGWTAAYAPGLFRVGTGPIDGLYGADEIGVAATYTKDDLRVAFDITNGFFGEANNNTSLNDDEQQGKNAYAYTVDVGFTLPEKKGSVDLEAVYDVNGGLAGADDATGARLAKSGDAYHLGANATLTPSEQLTVGAEAIWQNLQAAKDSTGDDESHTGLLAMANYKLPKGSLPFDASVTAMAQYVSVSKYQSELYDMGVDTAEKAKITELSLALLTQPAGTDRLGVNVELAYTMFKAEDAVIGAGDKVDADAKVGAEEVKSNSFSISLEALYVLP